MLERTLNSLISRNVYMFWMRVAAMIEKIYFFSSLALSLSLSLHSLTYTKPKTFQIGVCVVALSSPTQINSNQIFLVLIITIILGAFGAFVCVWGNLNERFFDSLRQRVNLLDRIRTHNQCCTIYF